jgi:hypothetical protein
MIYKPDYTLTTQEGTEVHFLFASYAYKKYCERKGIELEDLLNIVLKSATDRDSLSEEEKLKYDERYQNVPNFKAADFEAMLLSAHEAWQVYHKLPVSVPEGEASKWIDEMGGILTLKRQDIYKLFFCRLLNVDPGALSVETETVNDSSEAQKLPNGMPPVTSVSPGEASSA